VGVGEPDVALAALEEGLEDALEVGAYLVEGLEEDLARGAVDLADGGDEVVAGGDQIGALLEEEAEAAVLLRVLLDREHVDGPDGFELAGDLAQLVAPALRVLAIDGVRLPLERLPGASPLDLESLYDALGAGLQLGDAEV